MRESMDLFLLEDAVFAVNVLDILEIMESGQEGYLATLKTFLHCGIKLLVLAVRQSHRMLEVLVRGRLSRGKLKVVNLPQSPLLSWQVAEEALFDTILS